MRPLAFVLLSLSLPGTAGAALKPIEADLRPIGNKAVAVYKTTPQGDLKINFYFPPDWKASDRRPAIVFFFGGSCAGGSPAQFASTAEYFAGRGLVAAAPEYRIANIHHTPPERCIEDGRSADISTSRRRCWDSPERRRETLWAKGIVARHSHPWPP